jgi:hypothetical protein
MRLALNFAARIACEQQCAPPRHKKQAKCPKRGCDEKAQSSGKLLGIRVPSLTSFSGIGEARFWKKIRLLLFLYRSKVAAEIEFVMKFLQIAILLWQRVRESNPCTSLERAVS